MKRCFTEERITEKHRLEFDSKGWTQVDLMLSKESIKIAIEGLEKIRKDSILKDYKPRRIYYDHLISNNLSAIEIPFNKSICNKNIHYLFQKAKIGSLIKKLMGWEKPCCDLARLFCMNNFKYRGNWHRDYDCDLSKVQYSSSKRDFILAGIYLRNQKGFRILKKEYDFNGQRTIVKNKELDELIHSFAFPLSPPSDSFYEIEGKVGHVLFFDPLLLHQGSTYGSRLDFHMKFCESKEMTHTRNNFQDFDVIDILNEDFNLPKNSSEIKAFENKYKIPFVKRDSISEKLRNSIDYRLGLRSILKMNKIKNQSYQLIKNEGWKIDWFSNTQWQQ